MAFLSQYSIHCSNCVVGAYIFGAPGSCFVAYINPQQYQQMAIIPPARPVRRAVDKGVYLLPLALVYGYLLIHSWQPDTLQLLLPGSLAAGFSGGFNPQFFPSLQGIGQLFSRLITAASLWVHLLAINLFAARAVYLDGMFGVCTNMWLLHKQVVFQSHTMCPLIIRAQAWCFCSTLVGAVWARWPPGAAITCTHPVAVCLAAWVLEVF